MLFLGHFSFLGHHPDGPNEGEPMSGHFSCVVEADDVEAADRRIRALVNEHRRKFDEFAGVSVIFMDALVAIKAVPKKGAVTYFAEYFQDLPDTLSAALPHASSRHFDAYSLEPDDEGDEDEAEAVPFMVFEGHEHHDEAEG